MKVIQYDPNQEVINLGETFFKIVGLLEVQTPTANDVTLTEQQYLDWQGVDLQNYYINQSKFTIATAYFDFNPPTSVNDQKEQIINRMQQINNRRVVLFDLGVSEPSLDTEYNDLISQYNPPL